MNTKDLIKPILLIALTLILTFPASAQSEFFPVGYYRDVVRFSQQNPTGSARVRALGGAGVSLGGDISHTMLNPAGLGFMRKSEYHVSLGVGLTNSTTSGEGISGTAGQTRLFVPQIGAVFSSSKSSTTGSSKWRGGAFAISFNRIADFNSDVSYVDRSGNPTSLLNAFEESAYGASQGFMDEEKRFSPTTFAGMAYQLNLIKPVFDRSSGSADYHDPNFYYYTLDRDTDGFTTSRITERTHLVETRGGQYETSFAYGGNFDDKLYIGAKVGIQNVNYTKNSQYVELRDTDLTFLGLNERFRTTGWGINLQTGVIWRPIDAIRLGATITSPTWYALTDYYQATTTRNGSYNWNDATYQEKHFKDGQSYIYNPDGLDLYNPNAEDKDYRFSGRESSAHDEIRTRYNMNTPWKASGGVSGFFGKKGFLTLDVEYIGYSAMQLNKGTTYYYEYTTNPVEEMLNFTGDNAILDEEYRNTINIRVGGEYRLGKSFMLRAGYAYYQDPHKEEYRFVDQSRSFYSGGLGYRNNTFYADFSVVHSRWKGTESPYQLEDNFVDGDGNTILIYPIIDVDYSRTEFQLSVGKRF
ncbi:OmpP1/FadL family transporter [Flammeovirga sp. EKP202]|uniref:OmpP1/FadL family transporter n=1 Tax=Flammeovirga sp. EKP202 TaxID=2770592 RepID=UPI00165F8196|nr:outer membrane protein transport protein [Flammeovirga sp. EKP202]MBD0400155.1 outer membrane protein transport protein [Flammeovirga sp. EKP202]